jgi:hypothetical protein
MRGCEAAVGWKFSLSRRFCVLQSRAVVFTPHWSYFVAQVSKCGGTVTCRAVCLAEMAYCS